MNFQVPSHTCYVVGKKGEWFPLVSSEIQSKRGPIIFSLVFPDEGFRALYPLFAGWFGAFREGPDRLHSWGHLDVLFGVAGFFKIKPQPLSKWKVDRAEDGPKPPFYARIPCNSVPRIMA